MVLAYSACKLRIAHCFIISEEWHHGDKEHTHIFLGWQTGGREVLVAESAGYDWKEVKGVNGI